VTDTHRYALDAERAYLVGLLVGTLIEHDSNVKVSPTTDEAGNYLNLIRVESGGIVWMITVVFSN
jgi:hypothetical protein